MDRRPKRYWLWLGLAGLALLAFLAGGSLRLRGPAAAEAVMIGATALGASLLLAVELLSVLQGVQGREAAAAALRVLPHDLRVTGRVRIRGRGRPAVADHIVVGPTGDGWAVLVDGSTRPPRSGDPLDGLRPLLAAARRVAAAVQEAGRLGLLPPETGLGATSSVRPAILVARRPLAAGERDGVMAFAAGDAANALAGFRRAAEAHPET